jgi:hypothetical protein
MLQTALAKIQDCECHVLPVTHHGRLLGLVTTDNLAEVLMIAEALRSSRNTRHVPTPIGVRVASPPTAAVPSKTGVARTPI